MVKNNNATIPMTALPSFLSLFPSLKNKIEYGKLKGLIVKIDLDGPNLIFAVGPGTGKTMKLFKEQLS